MVKCWVPVTLFIDIIPGKMLVVNGLEVYKPAAVKLLRAEEDSPVYTETLLLCINCNCLVSKPLYKFVIEMWFFKTCDLFFRIFYIGQNVSMDQSVFVTYQWFYCICNAVFLRVIKHYNQCSIPGGWKKEDRACQNQEHQPSPKSS